MFIMEHSVQYLIVSMVIKRFLRLRKDYEYAESATFTVMTIYYTRCMIW